VCTYLTTTAAVEGSAKGPGGTWFHVTDAVVYFDHPVHAMAEHTLNIDLADPSRGPAQRVAVELTAQSARQLVAAIETALASAPKSSPAEVPATSGRGPHQARRVPPPAATAAAWTRVAAATSSTA
jgi:hypothetical protein